MTNPLPLSQPPAAPPALRVHLAAASPSATGPSVCSSLSLTESSLPTSLAYIMPLPSGFTHCLTPTPDFLLQCSWPVPLFHSIYLSSGIIHVLP